MHRFFVEPKAISDGFLTIAGEDFHHITRVLRIGPSEQVEVCDGAGTDHLCVIETLEGDQVIMRIVKSQPSQGENPWHTTLYQGLAKGQKMDEIIQKCVETGVDAVVPFISSRAVAKVKDKGTQKTERWQKIAYGAAKQSKRGAVPLILPPVTFDAVLCRIAEHSAFFAAYEDERGTSFKTALAAYPQPPEKIGLLVGPEGGLSPEEAAALVQAGARCVSLGRRILRTETAGMAMLAQLSFNYDQ
jgi:16S rRNA (uracil1498-N3)-methyltransferase